MPRTTQRFLGAVALAAAGLVATSPALAGSREVRLSHDVTLQGTVIPAGTYTLKWKDDGSDAVELTVRSGRNVVARATGARVALPVPARYDAVVLERAENGARELSRIVTAGRRDAIGFDTTLTARE
jgi:hypothetical protein